MRDRLLAPSNRNRSYFVEIKSLCWLDLSHENKLDIAIVEIDRRGNPSRRKATLSAFAARSAIHAS
jgi:hypothetical protein